MTAPDERPLATVKASIGSTLMNAEVARLAAENVRLTRELMGLRARYGRLHEQFVAYCRRNGVAPPPVPGDVEAAARHFATEWSELITSLPDEYECHMTCGEAEAAAGLYRALGDEAAADAVVGAHAAHDEPGEMHSEVPLAEAGEMAARLAELEPGTRPYAVGDRVLITGKGHPWKGHSGEISGPFETAADPGLRWRVALDYGTEAAVPEQDIRRADD